MDHEIAKRAIVTVGEGRGFVVSDERESSMSLPSRLVVTAAHCLPVLPPCASNSNTEERTYRHMLGPVGNVPTVAAEIVANLNRPGGNVTGVTLLRGHTQQ